MSCSALKVLVESNDDRYVVLQEGGVSSLIEAFLTVHAMHHEATACHVAGDIVDILTLITSIFKVTRLLGAEKKSKSMSSKYIFINV